MIALMVLLTITWQESAPGGFAASGEIAKEQISFDQPLSIDLSVDHPAGYSVDKNQLRRNLLRNATPFPMPFVLTQESTESKETRTTIHYTLDPQMPGDFTLSFFDINLSNPEGKKVTLFSPLFPIHVSPTTPQEFAEEPAPFLTLSRNIPVDLSSKNRQLLENISIKEPERNLKIQADRTFPWGLLGAACLATLAYIWFRFFRIPSISPERQALSAREKAWSALQKIKIEKPSSSEELYALSNTVRFYIEERYGIQAPQQTTQEFLAMMPTANLPARFPKEQLLNFLIFSDKVKFAKSEPTPEEREKAWNAAASLINS